MPNRLLVVAIPSSTRPAIMLPRRILILVLRHHRRFPVTTHITVCEEGVEEAITEIEIEVDEEDVDVAGITAIATTSKSKPTITIATALRTPITILPQARRQLLLPRQRKRSARRTRLA